MDQDEKLSNGVASDQGGQIKPKKMSNSSDTN